MQIVISRNSWHVKLYLWFYKIYDYQLPLSLCPYFWSLLPVLVLTVPFSVLALPGWLLILTINLMSKEKEQQPAPWIAAILGIIVLGVVCWQVTTVKGLISYFIHHKKPSDGELTAMIFSAISLLIIIIVRGIIAVGDRRRKSPYQSYTVWLREVFPGLGTQDCSGEAWTEWILQNQRTSFWKLIGTGIATIYRKACPIIDWR